LGGHDTHVSAFRLRAAAALAAAAVLAASVAACGSDSSSDASEPEGTFRVEATDADFAVKQRLGRTYLLKLGIRNSGEKTIPGLTVNFSIKGSEGENSTLPFGFRDPQPDLAQPDRPVWVLSEHYPKLAGSSEPGGAGSSNPKTFDFGPLEAGETTEAVWKLSAVRTGPYTLLYSIDAGFGGKAKAETGNGVAPGGSFVVRISPARYGTEVNDRGEVVEKK
jgi:hypothetical protein